MRGSSLASTLDSQLPLSADPSDLQLSLDPHRAPLRFPLDRSTILPPTSVEIFLRSWKENDIKITRLAEVRFCNLGLLRLSPPASSGFFFFFGDIYYMFPNYSSPSRQNIYNCIRSFSIYKAASGYVRAHQCLQGDEKHWTVLPSLNNPAVAPFKAPLKVL